MGSKQTVVPNQGIAAFSGFTAQAKPVQFDSAGATALHALPLSFYLDDATWTQGIGICSAMCATLWGIIRPVGAQSTAQPRHTR